MHDRGRDLSELTEFGVDVRRLEDPDRYLDEPIGLVRPAPAPEPHPGLPAMVGLLDGAEASVRVGAQDVIPLGFRPALIAAFFAAPAQRVIPNDTEATLAWLAREHQHRSQNWTDWCMRATRMARGVPPRYESAAVAWQNAAERHPDDWWPPRGAPVFTTGGSQGYGHAMTSIGNGFAWSTDAVRKGEIDVVSIKALLQKWRSHTYAGWTQDLNGFHVFDPQSPEEDDMSAADVEAIRADIAALAKALTTTGRSEPDGDIEPFVDPGQVTTAGTIERRTRGLEDDIDRSLAWRDPMLGQLRTAIARIARAVGADVSDLSLAWRDAFEGAAGADVTQEVIAAVQRLSATTLIHGSRTDDPAAHADAPALGPVM